MIKSLCCLSALLFSAHCLPASDPDLPQPFDYRALQSVVTQSPFSRTVSFDQTYQLTGIAYVDGHPVATLLNRETKKRFVITDQSNEQGWKLLSVSAETDPNHGQVEIQVGTETISLHLNGISPPPGTEGKGGRKSMLPGSDRKHDGEKVRPSNYLGERGKELYASLSPEARDKFKDLLKSRLAKNPELTNEQTSSYAKKVFAKLKSTDQPSGMKTAKPAKKKQGA
jgi:hypothetical protein